MSILLISKYMDKDSSLKELIVFSLMNNPFLTPKKLKVFIKSHFKKEFSSQAIYKILNQLIEEKKIIKLKKGFALNQEWIDSMGDLIFKFKESHNSKLITGIVEEDIKKFDSTLNFNSLEEIYNYTNNLRKTLDKKIFFHTTHLWWTLVSSLNNYCLGQNEKNESFFVCNSDSNLDKWLAESENSFGNYCKYGVSCPLHNDLFLFGDVVLEIHYPQILREKIDNFFTELKDIKKIDFNLFFKDIFCEKHSIKVLIKKDKEIAKHIKENIIGVFHKDLLAEQSNDIINKMKLETLDQNIFDWFFENKKDIISSMIIKNNKVIAGVVFTQKGYFVEGIHENWQAKYLTLPKAKNKDQILVKLLGTIEQKTKDKADSVKLEIFLPADSAIIPILNNKGYKSEGLLKNHVGLDQDCVILGKSFKRRN